MRFLFFGPRFLGIRSGISFGAEDFRKWKRSRHEPSEPMTGGFIYVIRGDHNLIKVGITTNPRARLSSLRTASAFPIDYSYLAAITGNSGAEIEHSVHQLLEQHRCHGEWFDVAPEMAVAAISGTAHKLGYPLLPVTTETADEILRIASTGETAPQKFRLEDNPRFIALCFLIGGLTTVYYLISSLK
jgi:Meiotically up-regulated gene 113